MTAFLSSALTDVNIFSRSNCPHSWVRVGQENFRRGYNSLPHGWQAVDRAVVLAAPVAIACLLLPVAGCVSASALNGGFNVLSDVLHGCTVAQMIVDAVLGATGTVLACLSSLGLIGDTALQTYADAKGTATTVGAGLVGAC